MRDGNWATLHTAEVTFWAFVSASGGLLAFLIVGGGGAGRAAGATGESEIQQVLNGPRHGVLAAPN